MKIDLVYLWVDGADIEWQRRRASYLYGVDQSDNETFCVGRTANSDELRYSLRSVDMYAPWINHIFIITDGQCPKWLERENPKISIIDHKDIFPAEVLPLYNSSVLEYGLHRIEGLAEHFLYINDDMAFGRNVSPDFFFTPDGRVKCHFFERKKSHNKATNSTYSLITRQANSVIAKDFKLDCERWTPHHQIDGYTKSNISKCLEQYSEWRAKSMNNRFRTPEDMHRHIFSLYAVATGNGIACVRKHSGLSRIAGLIKNILFSGGVTSLVASIHKKNIASKTKWLNPALICFNDTPQATNEDRARLKQFLEKRYPQMSQFEKGGYTPYPKIDLVYLWCDGLDPAWLRRREFFLTGVDQSDTESFCEGRIANNDELLYSMRSVEMYAPWINHIYIITDGQCPKWLNTDNPKVSIVDHSEIFPKEVLPLYNSAAIEYGIHRIKGLSEHYLYANDDMMFGRAVSPDFFFTPEGKVKCRFNITKRLLQSDSRLGTFMYKVKKGCVTIANDFGLKCLKWEPHHQIDGYKKSCVSKCIERYNQLFDTTIGNKFRSREDIGRHILLLYTVATGEGVAIAQKRKRKFQKAIVRLLILLKKYVGVDSMYLAINKRDGGRKIKHYKPALLCLNDSQKANDKNRADVKLLLKELYPQKSQFEK